MARKLHDLASFIPSREATAVRLTRSLRSAPGENGFLIIYMVSNWLPIIAASLGPIANLNSVVALADKWREPVDGGPKPADLKWVLGLNSVSLFFGCAANVSLFLNYARRIPYNMSQAITIGGFYLACSLLLSLFIATKFVYFDDTHYQRSQGFWHGVMTCILYFISASFLLANEIGHLRGHYTDSFNLTTRQRSIMVQNVALILWIGAGGALFGHLINQPFSDGVYWAVVTITTCGLGDIVPQSSLSRALSLPYAFLGVIQLGLIVSTIRQIVLEAGSKTVQFHHIERSRKKYRSADNLKGQEAFATMRRIRARALHFSQLRSALGAIILFIIFTMVGALVFYACEDDMNLFQCVYFCLLCLLTIGYGDYSPTSAPGRPFFVVWGLAAIPLMTILISSLGDTLFRVLLEGGDRLGNLFLSSDNEPLLPTALTPGDGDQCDDGWIQSRSIPDSDDYKKDKKDKKDAIDMKVGNQRVQQLCQELRGVINKLISEDGAYYDYDDWDRLTRMTSKDAPRSVDFADNLWLSENSPIRLPISEPHYFLERYFNALEQELMKPSN